MELAVINEWRQCSSCRALVERIDGCNHMVYAPPHLPPVDNADQAHRCRCGHRFCYQCGAARGTCNCGFGFERAPERQPPRPTVRSPTPRLVLRTPVQQTTGPIPSERVAAAPQNRPDVSPVSFAAARPANDFSTRLPGDLGLPSLERRDITSHPRPQPASHLAQIAAARMQRAANHYGLDAIEARARSIRTAVQQETAPFRSYDEVRGAVEQLYTIFQGLVHVHQVTIDRLYDSSYVRDDILHELRNTRQALHQATAGQYSSTTLPPVEPGNLNAPLVISDSELDAARERNISRRHGANYAANAHSSTTATAAAAARPVAQVPKPPSRNEQVLADARQRAEAAEFRSECHGRRLETINQELRQMADDNRQLRSELELLRASNTSGTDRQPEWVDRDLGQMTDENRELRAEPEVLHIRDEPGTGRPRKRTPLSARAYLAHQEELVDRYWPMLRRQLLAKAFELAIKYALPVAAVLWLVYMAGNYIWTRLR